MLFLYIKVVSLSLFSRVMSGKNLETCGKNYRVNYHKDFSVATPEEFVRRFKGNRVINKVSFSHIPCWF